MMPGNARISSGIGIIGASRLGTTLGLALQRAGEPVVAVASQRTVSAQAFAARLTGVEALEPAALVARCELVVLAVPDGAVASLAAALPWVAGQHVVHCSGALALSALDPARARGALRGCLHPLQSFPERFGDAGRFDGIACGAEGDGTLEPRLHALSRALGATPLPLAGVDRARYHAAAVLASNYVVALHAAAAAAWTLAGLPPEQARQALAPLTQGAADAVRRLPLPAALTGPIARGDAATVARHVAALATDPELQQLYQRLGGALLALPLELAPEQRAALESVLRKAL
jgi:predicted short-subunit dehydrogenase-like oxidoreductase (DUF2520 family)